MRKLNRQRANLFLSEIMNSLHISDVGISEQLKSLENSFPNINIPSPRDISLKEKIFERDGVLRWRGGKQLGFCKLGVALKSILSCLGPQDPRASSFGTFHSQKFQELMSIYKNSDYILYFDKPCKTFLVAIKSHQGNTVEIHMKAWIQALYLAKFGIPNDQSFEEVLQRSCLFADYLGNMIMSSRIVKELGWDLESSAMEVHSGMRIKIGTRDLIH